MTECHIGVEQEILGLERAALERWCHGDPSGFLEISAEDVTYFDPFLKKRITGIADLSRYYESLRGKVFAPSFEIVDPLVQDIGETAILTFRFHSRDEKGSEARWNCTEVYHRTAGQWRIVQTHWSFEGAGAVSSSAAAGE